MGRTVALAGALLMIALLLFLTLRALIRDGFDAVVLISILVLALMGVGVLGALTAPSDD
jgi:hypothetical protein